MAVELAINGYYRAYVIDSYGKIKKAEEIEAGSDGEAVIAAKLLENMSGIELWEGARLVIRIDPSPAG
jgi:hypothetical protein